MPVPSVPTVPRPSAQVIQLPRRPTLPGLPGSPPMPPADEPIDLSLVGAVLDDLVGLLTEVLHEIGPDGVMPVETVVTAASIIVATGRAVDVALRYPTLTINGDEADPEVMAYLIEGSLRPAILGAGWMTYRACRDAGRATAEAAVDAALVSLAMPLVHVPPHGSGV